MLKIVDKDGTPVALISREKLPLKLELHIDGQTKRYKLDKGTKKDSGIYLNGIDRQARVKIVGI